MTEEGMDLNSILLDFNTRIKDFEERHTLLKERVLLLGQSFLKQGEEIRKELEVLKSEIKEMRLENERSKEMIDHIVQESDNFAKKEDIRAIEKYMKIWEPLKFVRADQIEELVEEALKKKNKHFLT